MRKKNYFFIFDVIIIIIILTGADAKFFLSALILFVYPSPLLLLVFWNKSGEFKTIEQKRRKILESEKKKKLSVIRIPLVIIIMIIKIPEAKFFPACDTVHP